MWKKETEMEERETRGKLVAVCGSRRQRGNEARLRELFAMLRRQGMEIVVQERFGRHLEELGFVPGADMTLAEEYPREAETLVSIGGDGTFLRAARWAGDAGTPIIGLNTGHLGFLASYSLSEIGELVDVICRRSGRLEPRLALELSGRVQPEDWPYALNEVAIVKSVTASMVTVRAYIDGEFLADYRSDGLVISTPTGSTAYNLSVGGPILEPTLRSMILAPIAPHSLTMRPLVVPGESRIDLEVYSRAGECHVALDGRTYSMECRDPRDMTSEREAVKIGEEEAKPDLRITAAPFSVNVLRRPGSNNATLLREKLLWGIH